MGHNDLANKAISHTEQMGEKYAAEIEKAITSTLVYDNSLVNLLKASRSLRSQSEQQLGHTLNTKKVRLSVEAITASSAAFKYANCGKVALLNFASYKNPGGGFIRGSMAQEEALCHDSFLYNVLKEFPDYYAFNNKNTFGCCYTNRALYTPNVIFQSGDHKCAVDVISCAAVNKTAGLKFKTLTEEHNSKIMRDRLDFILEIARDNFVDTLILGAFGCGVFGQDPVEIAQMFNYWIAKNPFVFKQIIFAVPDCRSYNYRMFAANVGVLH